MTVCLLILSSDPLTPVYLLPLKAARKKSTTTDRSILLKQKKEGIVRETVATSPLSLVFKPHPPHPYVENGLEQWSYMAVFWILFHD
jgi:hypothetical protein